MDADWLRIVVNVQWILAILSLILNISLVKKFRERPWMRIFAICFFGGAPTGLIFWSEIKNFSTQPTFQVAVIGFVISTCIGIILFLTVGLPLTGILLEVVELLPLDKWEKTKWSTPWLAPLHVLPFLPMLFSFLIAYGPAANWSVSNAERLVNVGLSRFLLEASGIVGDNLFNRLRGVFVALALVLWIITIFLIVQAQKRSASNYQAKLMFFISLMVTLGGAATLTSFVDTMDHVTATSALFAFPLGLLVAGVAGIAITLFLGYLIERFGPFDDKFKVLVNFYFLAVLCVAPFIASWLVSEVTIILLARTEFLADLLNRTDKFWREFWIWLANIASVITVWEFATKILRRRSHREEILDAARLYYLWQSLISEQQAGAKSRQKS